MAGSTLEQRGSKTMTTSTLSTEEAIVALKQHVEEFIVLELNNRLEEQIQQLVKQGALDLADWDGVHLEIPAS